MFVCFELSQFFFSRRNPVAHSNLPNETSNLALQCGCGENAHYNIGADTGERAYPSMLSVACEGGTNLEARVALSAQVNLIKIYAAHR